jgi:hypothetical protein
LEGTDFNKLSTRLAKDLTFSQLIGDSPENWNCVFDFRIFGQFIDVTLVKGFMVLLKLIKLAPVSHNAFFKVLAILMEILLRFFLVYGKSYSIDV